MDDVTIDVEQYGDDDGIKLSDNPTFAMTVDHPDPLMKMRKKIAIDIFRRSKS